MRLASEEIKTLYEPRERYKAGTSPVFVSNNFPKPTSTQSTALQTYPETSVAVNRPKPYLLSQFTLRQDLEDAQVIYNRSQQAYIQSEKARIAEETQRMKDWMECQREREMHQAKLLKIHIDGVGEVEKHRIDGNNNFRKLVFYAKTTQNIVENTVLLVPRLLAGTAKLIARDVFRIKVDTSLDLFPEKEWKKLPQIVAGNEESRYYETLAQSMAATQSSDTPALPPISQPRRPYPPLLPQQERVGLAQLAPSSASSQLTRRKK